MTLNTVLGRAALALAVAGSAGPALAQAAGNPLVGAWTAQSQDPATGGMIVSTSVYNPDGTFAVTSRGTNGNLFRLWGRYQAQPSGPNQMRIEGQVGGSLPHQICSIVPGGLTTCGPAPQITSLPPIIVTFLDVDTMQDGSLVSRRDPSPMLAQVFVPDTITQVVQASPVPYPNPAPYPGPTPTPGPQTCSLGQTQCFAHYARTCEAMATGGTWWVTSGVRCD